jgi:hypothetical protein
MFCKYCGKDIEQKAELCVHCGRRIRSSFSTFMENSELTQLRPQKVVKSPGLAAFLGFVCGWLFLGPVGYLYLGQWNWCWMTIIISIIAYPITALFAYPLFPFIFAFHQYQMAKELNEMLAMQPPNLPDRPEPPGNTEGVGSEPKAPHESN